MTFFIAANERDDYEAFLSGVERTNDDDDIMFVGDGGLFGIEYATIAVERKKVYEDLPRCVVQSHHHLNQLRRMRRRHQATYLLIEGPFQPDRETGLFFVPQWTTGANGERKREWRETNPPILYHALMRHLESIRWCLGVEIRFTRSFPETCAFLKALYGWWQKPLEEHTSAHQWMELAPPNSTVSMGVNDPSIMQRIFSTMPGIGWKLSRDLANLIQYPAAMQDVDAKTLMQVPGVGRKKAEGILAVWNGEK